MKIFISIGTLGLGGAEKQAVSLANKLSQKNEVSLLTYHGGARHSDLSKSVSWIRLIPEITSYQNLKPASALIESKEPKEVQRNTRHKKEFYFLFFSPQKVKALKVIWGNYSRYNSAREAMAFFAKKSSSETWCYRLIMLAKKYLTYRSFKYLLAVVRSYFFKVLKINKIQLKLQNLIDTMTIFFRVYREISAKRPDFVITFLYHDTLLVGIATILRINPPKLIVGRRSPLGYGGPTRSFLEKKLLRFIYRKARFAVTNSLANLNQALEDGLQSSKIILINNFVEENSINFVSATNNYLNLICVANFFDYKNHINLVEALSSLRDKVKITFLGDGPTREKIIKLSKELEINARFVSHNEQQNLLKFEIDFMILTSKAEGSSNALLEALASGYPCIATNVGSVPDLLKLSAPIIVSNKIEVEDIRAAILIGINQKEKYKSAALDFRKTMVKEYGAEKLMNEWRALMIK